jgi:Domain of unknown function (DUF4190)
MTAPGPSTPQYPPQGYYYPPAYQQPRGTNTLAILSLVFAFVVPIAGIVLGHIARSQIRRTGEDGDGLALAGLIVSYIGIALSILVMILIFGLIGFGALASTGGGS